MFDERDRSWTAKSAIAANADAEIFFSLLPEFHKDPNVLDETSAIALPAPAIASAEPFSPSAKEVVNNEAWLAEHYLAVLNLAHQHGQSYNEICHHMWLRLLFEWDGSAIPFPWYDTLEPMEHLFYWLHTAGDGDALSDVEQGWEMISVRIGSRFHFRLGGFDQGGEYANVALPRDELLASISSLRERMRTIVARLSAEVGEDYWTRHRYDLRTDLT